jgi:Xaa-Pro aminopeptidase
MSAISDAQEFMRGASYDGWLTRDYRYSNPVFEAALGARVPHLTRPVWLFIPRDGEPLLLAHDVDAGRFPAGSPRVVTYSNRQTMVEGLRRLLSGCRRVAMEYSPMYELPRVGRVDAGTVELVRSLGADVVPSGDVLQYATERWSPDGVASHRYAVEGLVKVVREACTFVAENVRWKLTEHDVAEFIRGRYDRLGLAAEDGPIVAFDEHSSDPHYEPRAEGSAVIRRRGWLLLDFWARRAGDPGAVFADITWVASLGGRPTAQQQEVFTVVRDARDAAFDFLNRRMREGEAPRGWEVDRVARQVIEKAGYGRYFVHRLGHSLGREVHANGVNLDDWETHDTRTVVPGIGVTIEPGVYLPEFGMRSEIDVYMGADGPEVTGESQKDVIVVETGA